MDQISAAAACAKDKDFFHIKKRMAKNSMVIRLPDEAIDQIHNSDSPRQSFFQEKDPT